MRFVGHFSHNERIQLMATQQRSQESCIEACFDCVRSCETCIGNGLPGGSAMAECLRLCLECADLCQATARVMIRKSPNAAKWAEFCATICEACAMECDKHDMEDCRRCAEVCRRCAEECRAIAQTA